jgi:hypothetical protein
MKLAPAVIAALLCLLAALQLCHAHAIIPTVMPVAGSFSMIIPHTYGDATRELSLAEQYGSDGPFEDGYKICETLVPQILAVAAKEAEADKAAAAARAKARAIEAQKELQDTVNLLAGKPVRQYPSECEGNETAGSINATTGAETCMSLEMWHQLTGRP